MQSVSLFSINNVKWQIPWRTLSHLYTEGIVFRLLTPKCLDWIFIKADSHYFHIKYFLFQSKLTFWEVFTPKAWSGCRIDLFLGHTHSGGFSIFLEEMWWWPSRLTYLPPTEVIQHRRSHAPSLSRTLQMGVLQTQVSSTQVPKGNFSYTRLIKHYKHSPLYSPDTWRPPAFYCLWNFLLNHLFEHSYKGCGDFRPVAASLHFPQDFAKSLPAASFPSRTLRHQIQLQETWQQRSCLPDLAVFILACREVSFTVSKAIA